MRGRGVLVVAILAALVWAPPTASAATNLLDSPEAAPASGTTSTVFRLRVSYEGRFPALRVEVTVANRTVPMTLVTGSPADGTWEVSIQLPAGTWPVVFDAVAERGNSPTLTGPTLTVAGPETAPTPVPSHDGGNGPPGRREPGDPPQPDPPGEPGARGATAAPAPTGGEAPGEGTSAGEAGQTDAPTMTEPLEALPGQSPAAPTRDGGGGTGEVASDDDPPDVPDPMTAERTVADDGDAAPLDPADPAPAESEATLDEGLLDDALRITAVWAAVLLAAGSVMLGLVVRRRRREAADAEAMVVAAETEALLQRRALRRAHVLMPDDPIVASMGLDETAPINRRTERRRRRRRDREER